MKKFAGLWILLISLPLFKVSAANLEVFYAGVSYLGESQYINQSYPFISKINNNQNGVFFLDDVTRNIVKSVHNPNFTINSSGLADLNNESQLTMTLAISSETSSVEKIGDSYRLWLQVLAQVFIFDFKKMKIVANEPIALSFVEIYPSKPTDEIIQAIYKEQFFSNAQNGALQEFLKALVLIAPNIDMKNTMQVSSVTISDAARSLIPAEQSSRQIQQKIGETFTQFLSSSQSVTMLPYVKGHAIGNKLAGKFSDGKVYTLELPEPDYAIDIDLTHLIKKKHDEKSAGSSWIYVARSRFRFYEPLSGQTIFDEFLFNGAAKVIPVTQHITDEWPVYQEALFVLFDKFTKQISNPDRDWLKTYSQSTAKFAEFKKLKEIIESCR
jgi:hypothetical protein